MLGQQRVQLGDPDDALRQLAADQPAARLVLDLHIVMGLGPVVPDEQQRRSSSSATRYLQPAQEEETQRANGSVLGGTTPHQLFDLLTTSSGTI
jgi:hypothetical protein